MNIVHAVYGLEMGGQEVLVAQLARLQRAQGHHVTLFSYAKLGVLGEALRADGFDIYIPGEAHPLVTMVRYLRRFLTLKPHVVHSHGIAPAIHATIPARLAGVPSVVSTRHNRVDASPHNGPAEIKFNLMGWFCSWVTGICDVTCNGLRRGPIPARGKIIRIYNGTEPIVRANFDHLQKRGFTVVSVGRVVPEKSLETLIRAVAVARKSNPFLSIDLWIVGGGPALPGLEALVALLELQDAVTFWGQQLDIAPFFSAADVFAMSSISEGLPMSLLQSMSLGTPSILSDIDGMGEILRLTGGGLLVPLGDVEGFAAAIVSLAINPDLYAELSRKAHEAYVADFTLEKMAANYMELYLSG